MTRHGPNPRRLAAGALAALLALAACGGGSDADSDDTRPDGTKVDDTEPVVDTAAPVDTATVDTAMVEATTTTAPATDPPATDPAATDAPADDEFCRSAEQFFLPGRALDFSDINQPAVLRSAFDLLNATVPTVIDLAPTDVDAALFVESQRLLDIATPGLEVADYDLENAGAIADGAAVGQALIDFGNVLGDIQGFLVERCGSDRLALDDEARELAADLEAGVVEPETTDSAATSGLRDTRIIGGRDGDDELFFLPVIVVPFDEPRIRDTIVESFLL